MHSGKPEPHYGHGYGEICSSLAVTRDASAVAFGSSARSAICLATWAASLSNPWISAFVCTNVSGRCPLLGKPMDFACFRMRSFAQTDMLGARFTSVGTSTVQARRIYSSPPLVGVFNIEADVHQKGEVWARRDSNPKLSPLSPSRM
jgi:hypothetical protein